EIQALVSKSSFGYARRRAQGFDYNRLALLIAVLEKRIGLHLEAEDVFVNVAGGIKVEDPTADLAVALAIASAFREEPVVPETVVLGEIGLAGEIRSISQAVLRINEAQKLGFKACLLPKNNYKNLNYEKNDIELIPVSTLKEALDIALRR
ncbi:MAG: magnesium chelatase domain-containing protein, partial [Candidatus Omnitrophica bacterium]|nr:magnesium chelatase domain-containing protein [Candidatus Omnitrophota bacterium]